MSVRRAARRFGTRHIVVALAAVVTLAGCTSSKSGGASGGTTSPANSSAASTRSAASAGASTSPAANTGASSSPAARTSAPAGSRAACTDVETIKNVSLELGRIGEDLAKGKVLIARLSTAAQAFAKDAPGSVVAAARRVAADTKVLAAVTARAKTVAELRTKSKTDPAVKAAELDLNTSGNAIEVFEKTC